MNSEPILRAIIKKNPTWERDAVCPQSNPELFFAESVGSANEARKVCVDCPVISECLTTAVLNGEQYGIWGGHTTAERPQLRTVSHYADFSREALSKKVRARIRP